VWLGGSTDVDAGGGNGVSHELRNSFGNVAAVERANHQNVCALVCEKFCERSGDLAWVDGVS